MISEHLPAQVCLFANLTACAPDSWVTVLQVWCSSLAVQVEANSVQGPGNLCLFVIDMETVVAEAWAPFVAAAWLDLPTAQWTYLIMLAILHDLVLFLTLLCMPPALCSISVGCSAQHTSLQWHMFFLVLRGTAGCVCTVFSVVGIGQPL